MPTKGNCANAYRKPGSNAVHCKIQAERGGQWDFCAHQYYCNQSRRWEMTAQANRCPLPEEAAAKKKTSPGKKKTAKQAKESEPVKEAEE